MGGLTLSVHLGVALLASVAGYYDLRARQAPNWVTLSMLGGALLWRSGQAWRFQAWRPLMWGLMGFAALQILWAMGGLGGADAKLFGALWLLWPTTTWLLLWLASLILGSVAYRIARGTGPLPALGPGALAAWLHIGYLLFTHSPRGIS